MKKLIAVLFILFSSSVMATDAFWEKSRVGYTIYIDGQNGGYATTPFEDLQTPRNVTKITNVSWDWNTLPNGAFAYKVTLCYIKPYSWQDYKCTSLFDQQGMTDAFNGLDARGSFGMKMEPFGGTYPIYSTQRVADTLRVDYNY